MSSPVLVIHQRLKRCRFSVICQRKALTLSVIAILSCICLGSSWWSLGAWNAAKWPTNGALGRFRHFCTPFGIDRNGSFSNNNTATAQTIRMWVSVSWAVQVSLPFWSHKADPCYLQHNYFPFFQRSTAWSSFTSSTYSFLKRNKPSKGTFTPQ